MKSGILAVKLFNLCPKKLSIDIVNIIVKNTIDRGITIPFKLLNIIYNNKIIDKKINGTKIATSYSIMYPEKRTNKKTF